MERARVVRPSGDEGGRILWSLSFGFILVDDRGRAKGSGARAGEGEAGATAFQVGREGEVQV
jgi:hypothetical protein